MEINILKEMIQCTEALSTLLRSSFGPCGMDIALKTASGSLLVTKSGSSCIKTFVGANSYYRLLADQILKFHSVTGDFSKSFIFILNSTLRGLYDKLLENAAKLDQRVLQYKLFNSITIILEGINDVVQEIEKYVTLLHPFEESKEKVLSIIRDVCRNNLYGLFGNKTGKVLKSIVLEFVAQAFECSESTSIQGLTFLETIFNTCCVEVCGMDINNSRLENCIIIERETLTFCEGKSEKEFCRFVLLKHALALQPDTDFKVFNRQGHKLPALLNHQRKILGYAINTLKKKEIDLVICQEKIEYGIKAMLMNHFSILESVQDSCADRLCYCFGIEPLGDLNDITEASVNEKTIGVSSFLRGYLLGNNKFTSLGRPATLKNINFGSTVILCSPSFGLGLQYKMALLDLIKAIKMTITYSCIHKCCNHPIHLCVLPAGGTVEFILSDILRRKKLETSCGTMYAVLDILSTAFKVIPQLLHKNSIRKDKKRFVDIEFNFCHMLSYFSGKKDVTSHYSFWEELPLMHKSNAVEPFQSKVILIQYLLQFLRQILKIESVVAVNRIGSNINTDESDSDE